jgi:uncharacterized cupredoxin-like copper-binding protein
MSLHNKSLAILFLSTLLIAGCAAKPTEVKVTLAEFSVVAQPASAPAGTPIIFTITNTGTLLHELVLEPSDGGDAPLEANGVESEAEDIEPGQTVTLEWTVTEPGEYQLACYVEGHFEAGMVAAFTVTE